MNNYPRITIVTPNFNQAPFLEQTIRSVLDQNYPNLEYIIIDGGSTDESVDIIKKYESKLNYWVSEKDMGIYDAIRKGFAKSSGEIMGWINSDDVLHANSLFVLARCFSNPKVNWVQGLNTTIDINGHVIQTCRPFNTSIYDFMTFKYLQGDGFKPYGTIQQESTYWRRELYNKVEGLDLSYKYAGDFKLFMKFFEVEKLFLVDSLIGAFRKRSDQVSAVKSNEYIEETKKAVQETLIRLDKRSVNLVHRLRFYESLKNNFLKKLFYTIDVDYKRKKSLAGRKSNYIHLGE